MRLTFRLLALAIAVLAMGLFVVERGNVRRHEDQRLSPAAQKAALLSRAKALEEKARRNLKEHADGRHCLDPRNGALPGIYAYVKDHLSDPASFVPLGSEITPANLHGEHLLTLSYRAARSNGGAYQRSETFVVQNSDCSFER